jgi:transposase-like protein
VLRQLGDEVCHREELEALSEVRVVFRVEEDIGALLLEGDLAHGDRRPGHILRKALHGSRIVEDAIEPGSTVITDGWDGYEWLEAQGYRHKVRLISGSGKTASTLLPRVHRVASLLKRWLLGTHQGGVSRDHIEYYLDEFTLGFNRRASKYRGKLLYRLLQQAVAVDPVPFRELVSPGGHPVRGR